MEAARRRAAAVALQARARRRGAARRARFLRAAAFSAVACQRRFRGAAARRAAACRSRAAAALRGALRLALRRRSTAALARWDDDQVGPDLRAPEVEGPTWGAASSPPSSRPRTFRKSSFAAPAEVAPEGAAWRSKVEAAKRELTRSRALLDHERAARLEKRASRLRADAWRLENLPQSTAPPRDGGGPPAAPRDDGAAPAWHRAHGDGDDGAADPDASAQISCFFPSVGGLTLRFGRPAPAPPEKPTLVAKYTKEQRRALESFASDDLLSVPELPVPSCVADQPDAREAALLRYRQLAALPQPAAAQ